MKKSAITFILLLFVHLSFAQIIKIDTISKYGLTEIGKTIDGKKEGKWTTYEKGKILKIVHYQNDNQHGEEIFYYDNGQIKDKGNYMDDELDGEYLGYFRNGKIKSIGHYKNGIENGKFVEYFENGNIEFTGSYTDGIEEGEFAAFTEEGKVINKGSFKNGIKIGIWTETEKKDGGLGFPETIQIKTIDYDKDEATVKIYYKNGVDLWKTEFYKNDILVQTIYQSDVELNEKKFNSKNDLVNFLNKNIVRASIGYNTKLNFTSLGEIDYAKPSLKFKVENDTIYLHTYLPSSFNCDNSHVETLATILPKLDIGPGYFYIEFNGEFTCSGNNHDYIHILFNELPQKDILKIRQYFKDQEEKYYKIHFKNSCREELYLLLNYKNDDTYWQIDGWKTIKPNESMHVASTQNDTVYFYAITKSGIVFQGDSVRSYDDKEYNFIKWEIDSPKGFVGRNFTCD